MLTQEIMENHVTFSVGDKVIVRKRQKNKTLPKYDPNPYTVCSNMIVAREMVMQ